MLGRMMNTLMIEIDYIYMSVSYLNGLYSSKFLKQSTEDSKHFVLFKRIKMPSFKRMQQTLKFSLWKKKWKWHGHQLLAAWFCRVFIKHANMKRQRNRQKVHWQRTNERTNKKKHEYVFISVAILFGRVCAFSDNVTIEYVNKGMSSEEK
jgi:hypothetical protein